MAGPMGGGTQNAILSQMMRKKQTQDTLNSPGAVGGIGQQQQSPADGLGALAGMAGPEAGLMMGGLQKAGGFLSDTVTGPFKGMAEVGRRVQGMGPKLAETIQGGPGAGLQSALMNAMNAGKPGIGGPAPIETASAVGGGAAQAGAPAPEPFNPNEEAQRLDIIRAGQPSSAPPAPVSGPQPQGTTPGTPAPGQPFRSEDLAAPVGPNMNKQRRRPGII